MHRLCFLIAVAAGLTGCASEPSPEIKQVDYHDVAISDDFFLPRILLNDTLIIPQNFKMSEETGRIENFVKAARREGTYNGRRYDDSDVYKIIEGAAYTLRLFPDIALESYVDSLIGLIAAAQEKDGYLYTVRTMKPGHSPDRIGKERWELVLNGSHEIYNMGHLFEAAAAWYHATGKTNLLDVAVKSADMMVQTFGYDKLRTAPGHQGVEMGLVRLYDITQNEDYLNLAKFFIEMRGRVDYPYDPDKSWESPENRQTHKPFTEQFAATGHAVRAVYMYAGAADLVRKGKAPEYMNNLKAIWNDVISGKIYITGGIGNDRELSEAFGESFYLPNLEAYCETCAAVANVFWNHRMFLLTGESKYYDVLEVTLYNGLLSGLSLDDAKFFYPNPLEFDGKYHFNADNSMVRMPWFSCSCCPTNISRFLPQVGNYLYARQGDTIFINLYTSNQASIPPLQLEVKSDYPWEGNIKLYIKVDQATDAALAFRIPGWLKDHFLPGSLYTYREKRTNEFHISVNGIPVTRFDLNNGYCIIRRTWSDYDFVELDLPMQPRINQSDSRVAENHGKVAVTYGPLVYCAEEVDNPDFVNTGIPESPAFDLSYKPELLNGVNQLTEVQSGTVLVPYHAWSNRSFGKMKIWLDQD